jgi:hypothetical protein
LGEGFYAFAERMVAIGLPDRAHGQPDETGDLSRQIRQAKKLGSSVSTEWTHITDIMNRELEGEPPLITVLPR